jgi:hypothetical protein
MKLFLIFFLNFLLISTVFPVQNDNDVTKDIRSYQNNLIIYECNEITWRSLLECTFILRKFPISTVIEEVYNCIQQISIDHWLRLTNCPCSTATIGPSTLKLGMVTFLTKDILNYSLYSIIINFIYCINNNYFFKIIDNELMNKTKKNIKEEFDFYDFRWNKVKIIELALRDHSSNMSSDVVQSLIGWGNSLDYIMWIDADFIFLDLNMKIEEIISFYPFSYFVASEGELSLHIYLVLSILMSCCS